MPSANEEVPFLAAPSKLDIDVEVSGAGTPHWEQRPVSDHTDEPYFIIPDKVVRFSFKISGGSVWVKRHSDSTFAVCTLV